MNLASKRISHAQIQQGKFLCDLIPLDASLHSPLKAPSPASHRQIKENKTRMMMLKPPS